MATKPAAGEGRRGVRDVLGRGCWFVYNVPALLPVPERVHHTTTAPPPPQHTNTTHKHSTQHNVSLCQYEAQTRDVRLHCTYTHKHPHRNNIEKRQGFTRTLTSSSLIPNGFVIFLTATLVVDLVSTTAPTAPLALHCDAKQSLPTHQGR